MNKICLTLSLTALLVTALTAQAARELDDAEMDDVHAGNSATVDTGAELADPLLESASSLTFDNSINTITLSDNAQQNLSAFVNVLAINSNVQVMMNFNVAIDSNIGSVTQDNHGQIQ